MRWLRLTKRDCGEEELPFTPLGWIVLIVGLNVFNFFIQMGPKTFFEVFF
jgi:hypothetical protein